MVVVDAQGETPLMHAARSGHAAAVAALLASPHAHIDVNWESSFSGCTALGLAAASGREDIVATLLDAETTDANTSHSLLRAAACGAAAVAIVRRLLTAGADAASLAGVATPEAVRRLLRSPAPAFWGRARHHQFRAGLKSTVHTLLCLEARRGSACACAAGGLPPLPVELWLWVCEFLRSSDFFRPVDFSKH